MKIHQVGYSLGSGGICADGEETVPSPKPPGAWPQGLRAGVPPPAAFVRVGGGPASPGCVHVQGSWKATPWNRRMPTGVWASGGPRAGRNQVVELFFFS